MARIGFIGLGNMGLPMARNLLKAGHQVAGFDLNKNAVDALVADKGVAGKSATDVCKDADFVVTMLPAGEHVRSLYLGDNGIIAHVPQKAVLIDSSTIDVESARARHIQSSPLNWVNPNAAPTLIIHGTEDKYVAYEQALWMRDRLAACGVSVELLTLEGAGHGFKGADAEKADAALLAYFDKQLKR